MRDTDPFDLQLKAIIAQYSKPPTYGTPRKRKWREEEWNPLVVNLAKRTLALYRKWDAEEQKLLEGVKPWQYWDAHFPHVIGKKFAYYDQIELLPPSRLTTHHLRIQRMLVQASAKSVMYRLAALWGIEEATSLKEQVADAVLHSTPLVDILDLNEETIRNLVLKAAGEVAEDVRDTMG